MRPRLYEWDRLFRRPRFTLKKGVDYTCSQSSIAQQVRNAARNRVRVRIKDLGDHLVVEVADAAAK